RVQRPVEGLRGGGGQEADPTEIHAEDRRCRTVEGAGAAQQGAVAAEGDQAVELGCTVERRGRGLGPERRDLLLGVQRDPGPGRDLRETREDVLEIAVAGVADDPDVHEWVSDSSAASARTRAAIPAPVRPTSASCCARGACSYVRSGAPSGTTRVSGATVCTSPARQAPNPLVTVPSSTVTSTRWSCSNASSRSRSTGFRNRQFTTVTSNPSAASSCPAASAGWHIAPTASSAHSGPLRSTSQVP